MREWLVASGIVEGPEGLLLVCNRRRDGSYDWSPPGGVIETHAGETVTDGLSREVAEETGLIVTEWEGPLYHVDVVAVTLGWHLRVQTYRARSWSGEVVLADPDGIVVDATFVAAEAWATHLASTQRWVREPVVSWLLPVAPIRPGHCFRYRLDGAAGTADVVRLDL